MDNTALQQVLDIHKIKHVSISGKAPVPTRTKTLQEFRSSDRDGPRVLLLSNVGLTGLNLPCANILVIVVSFCFTSFAAETSSLFFCYS